MEVNALVVTNGISGLTVQVTGAICTDLTWFTDHSAVTAVSAVIFQINTAAFAVFQPGLAAEITGAA